MKKYLSIMCLAISSTCFGFSGHAGASLGGSTFINQDSKDFYQVEDKNWFTTFGAEAGFMSECYCLGLDFSWHYLNPTGFSQTFQDTTNKTPIRVTDIDSRLHVLSMFISTECEVGCGTIFRLGVGPSLGHNLLKYDVQAGSPNPGEVKKWTWGFSAKAALNFECGCFYLGPFAQYSWLRFEFTKEDLQNSLTKVAATNKTTVENFLLNAANCDHFTIGAELGMYF